MLYRQAETFGQSPAAILGITEPWIAYQFDQAVLTLGLYVSGKLGERKKNGKPKWTLTQILEGRAMKQKRGTMAQLLATFGRTVKQRKH